MFRHLARRLCRVTLADGTVLDGKLNPINKTKLLSGIVTLPDGRTYSGTYDATHGYPLEGSQLEEDGDLYRGGFNPQWQREGQGEAWLADGTYYKGIFRKDELCEGVVRIPNGTSEVTFEGVLADESFAKGTLTQHDFTYTGEFQDNRPHGAGKLVFATGAEQEGTFLYGKLHGAKCKMKLDGGFVYVGEFVEGHIRNGTLYTPTYTYEGQFNEHGRAHGEGSQTYLINEPRLTFTGIWDNGALVRGACLDEYGHPVDWQDNHAMQSKVLGNGEDGDAAVALNSYCGAKWKEADTLHRDMNSSYMRDADQVASKTGVFPSKMDLGYEGGIADENAAVQRASQKQMQDMESSRETLEGRTREFDPVASSLGCHVVGELNENMAKIQFSRQMGAQQLSAQRMDEQFERFMKSFDKPGASQSMADSPPSSSSGSKLHIEGNAPWKSFTPEK